MDPYNHSTPISTKLLILDTGKFKQWKFRIQQYLQHKHYALWEVIEFGDSYKAPPKETGKDKGPACKVSSSTKKKGRTVAITAEDMQKRKNDVKERTTLLLDLPDEYQLRFNKYDSAKELWEAILKTFGGNEATKKTKKNQLKQQYGNFKAKGLETLEQTFNRLQAIISHLEFIDVPIEQDDLNQKFLTSIAPEWLVYTIVWRNIDDLDTMSLDDVYNHLKVYEPEVQKRSGLNSQNMPFISSSNTSSGKSKVPTVQGASTASAQVPTISTDVAAASLSYDTIYAFIATQPNGSQIKYEDVSQIDDDDIEEIDIKWNLALLSMRADRFWKKTDHQGVKTKRKRESYKKDPKVEELAPKAMIAIYDIRWDWSYMAEEDEASKNHALVADKEKIPTEYDLMAKSSSSLDNEKRGLSQVETRLVEFKENEIKYCERIRVLERDIELKDNKIEYLRNELEEVKKEKESIDFKIEKFENTLKDLDRLLGSQKLDKDIKGVGFNEYCAVPPPPVQVYSPCKKDLSWMGLPEFVDGNVTDYTRPTPSIDVSKSGIPQDNIDDKGYWDSGCSRHMTGNISYFFEYEPFNRGYVSFGHERGKITGKGSIKTDFKLVDDKHVLLRTPRQQNMYTIDLKNVVPHKNLTCLIVKASIDESMLWHRRFSWTFFLKSKDETSRILRNFITEIENLKDLKVKIIRSDNGGEFRNKEMDEFCSRKGIKRTFSNARTPQQNGVTERRNMTLIEAARTMLADAKLPVTFWAEAVNTAFVVAGTSSTNILGTKEDAHQVVKEKESPLRFISLQNWFHEAQMATSNKAAKKDDAIPDNNSPQKEQQELASSSTVETEVLAVSSPVPPDSLSFPSVTSSVLKIISNGGSSFPKPLSLGNAMSFKNRLEDFFGDTSNAVSLNEVEADLSNMETAIQVLKNKKDERGIVIINKAHLVVQGHTQEEGINYEKVFAPVAKIKAIRLFLAYASYMGFTVYQMDVKSAFLYRTIDEEVYVMHPPGFQDLKFPHRVYKVEKAMYELHQAPRAWYGTLSKYLLDNGMAFKESKVPSPRADETAFPIGDVRYREAFPTDTSLDAGQDRENIAKTSDMPYEALPRVTSLGGGEGSMQQKLQKLMDTCTNLQRQHSLMDERIQSQDLEITQLKTRVKTLQDNKKKREGFAQEDAPNIKGMDLEEDLSDGDKSADKGSDRTDEMSHVLGSLGAVDILASRGLRSTFTTASLSVATASTCISFAVATASGSFPTAIIFTTASVATPTTRVIRSSRGVFIGYLSLISVNILSISKKDKEKEKMTEPEQPSKEKVVEQMSIQLAKDLEAKFAQEDQISREQAERDSEIAMIHAEKELEMMIAELDRSNEMIAKYLSEYEQASVGLSHDEKVELINELLMYQRHLAQIKKYQAQQNKPTTKTERRNFSMLILRSNEKMKDFVPMNSKLESERLKRPGIQLDKERIKKLKTAEASGIEPTQEQQSEEPKELSEEELKKIIELVPVEELYIEALQVKYPIIDWEIYSEGQRKYCKIIRVRNHTEVYQMFKDMLKKFDREDLDKL
nr:copia protein [Tanacetum cinerariifolium]